MDRYQSLGIARDARASPSDKINLGRRLINHSGNEGASILLTIPSERDRPDQVSRGEGFQHGRPPPGRNERFSSNDTDVAVYSISIAYPEKHRTICGGSK